MKLNYYLYLEGNSTNGAKYGIEGHKIIPKNNQNYGTQSSTEYTTNRNISQSLQEN